MFLKELNKNEVTAFLNLVSEFANIDHNFSKEEKAVMGEYLKELSLNRDDIATISLDEAVSILKSATDRVKRVVYFELVGIALVDDNYEESESEFLDNISKEFNITRAKRIAIANFFFNYTDIYSLKAEREAAKRKLLIEQAEKLFS